MAANGERMRREGVRVHVSVVDGVGIEVVQEVEVAKWCGVCNKDDRTLIFLPAEKEEGEEGEDGGGEGGGGGRGMAKCRGKNHGVVGCIGGWTGDRRGGSGGTFLFSVSFVIIYPWTQEDEASTWARVRLRLTCPCGEQTEYACQNNIRRPHRVECGGCGQLLLTDANTNNPRCVLLKD